jgi:hypothetical protein
MATRSVGLIDVLKINVLRIAQTLFGQPAFNHLPTFSHPQPCFLTAKSFFLGDDQNTLRPSYI